MELGAPQEQLQPAPPPQTSPLIFFHGVEDNKKFGLCSTSDLRNLNLDVKTIDDKLRSKKLHHYSEGWFVFKDEENNFSLWDPQTLELICLPHLVLRPEQQVNYCLIMPPPHDNIFVLFEKIGNSLFFCKLHGQEWTNLHINGDFKEDEVLQLQETVICNGMIYGLNFAANKLVKIDLSIPDHQASVVLDKPLPANQKRPSAYQGSLVESCNELFFIRLRERLPEMKEVVSVEVFRLDFSDMEWKKVEKFEDRSFFLNPYIPSFCLLARGDEIKGNHVYFTLLDDRNIYDFNMVDKTISTFLPRFNSLNSTYQPLFIVTKSRNLNGQNKNDSNGGDKGKKTYNSEIVKHSSNAEEDHIGGTNFDKLTLDLLSEIGKWIFFGDYISFRSVNKNCRIACPPNRSLNTAFEGFQDYNHLPPWLSYLEKGDRICNCFNILDTELYFMNIPNNSLQDVVMCCSSSGWCVMLQGENSIFLWNPSTKKTVLLPNLTKGFKDVVTCALSSTIDLVFVLYEVSGGFVMDLIFLNEGEWYSELFDVKDFEAKVATDSGMVYYNGRLYLFDVEGNLATLEEDEDGWYFREIQKVITSPCSSFDKCFLLESEENIMSIFVSLHGERIQIFTLDTDMMVWTETESLENKTVYVSQFSCFSTTPPRPDMENRIYFPRYYGKNDVVYYSPASKKLHTHGTDEVLENFNDTREQLSSCWVEAKK